jgi:Caspase domain
MRAMTGPRAILLCVATVLTLAVAATGVPMTMAQKAKPPAGGSGRHALLVGVTKYPNLEKRFELQGPANDVLLMRDLLLKHFGFRPEDIVVLAEHQGPDRLPTRANIEKEFKRLATAAQSGDQVVILLGGHGSQQPEDPNSKDPEPDGLDEIFLPRDVGKWDGATGKVKNAIIDDELGDWLKAIQAKKASVWIVFDACHSGTMTRGVNEHVRQANPDQALGVPKEALQKAREDAARRDAAKPKTEATRGGGPPPARPQNATPGGVVAFYACQDTEVTVEQDMPANSADARPYGLLTYTLVQVLTKAAEAGSRPLTYDELAQRIQAHYASLGRTSPTPLIEGRNEERDREVLGTKVWAGRSKILLERKGSTLGVTAGALHGLTTGSVLAVYPRPGDKGDDKMLGHVRITRLKTLDAEVEPCAYDDVPARAELPAGGRCEVVFVDYGSQRLRIAADPADDTGKPLTAAQRKQLSDALARVTADKVLPVEIVPDLAKADWLLRLRAGQMHLLPAAEWSRAGSDAGKPPLFGPYPADEDLKKSLDQIARIEALKKLAGASSEGGSSGDAVKVDVEILRFENEADKKGTLLARGNDGLTVYEGDIVGLRLRNPNRFAVDVTVLYITSDYGLVSMYPEGGQINRLLPDAADLTARNQISPPFGLENIVVVAVKAKVQTKPADFSFLAQPPLTRVSERAVDKQSPLEQLVKTAAFGQGNTRGIRRTAAAEYSLRLTPWRVVPGKRPAARQGSQDKPGGARVVFLSHCNAVGVITNRPVGVAPPLALQEPDHASHSNPTMARRRGRDSNPWPGPGGPAGATGTRGRADLP